MRLILVLVERRHLTIGKTLAQIANSSQVIAITHLPQIANNANKLVIVSKELIEDKDDKRTISLVKEVQGIRYSKRSIAYDTTKLIKRNSPSE